MHLFYYYLDHIDEAIGFLSMHNWVHELNLGHVDFEVKSKLVN